MNISNLSIEIFSLNDISYGTIDGSRIISDSLAGYSELNAIGNGEFMIALDDTESLDLLARNRIALCTYDSLTDTDLLFVILNKNFYQTAVPFYAYPAPTC